MTTTFCSVATAGHRDASIACLRSVHRRLPDAALALLDIDGTAMAVDGIRSVRLEECVPAPDLAGMRARYTTAELCFAAKPFLIAHLLGSGQVHYLDGDCLAFASLQPLCEQLAGADVLLTPHSLTPIPDDGRTPSALTVLRAGVFNAGYLGVRSTSEGARFAHWLCDMARKQAHNQPNRGMCGDQRWLDLVPALFPGAAICRHPGANVGYWNLHERVLARASHGSFQVNGEPLLFFHFSGFRSDRPGRLSIHQDRHAVAQGTPLAELLSAYCDRQAAAAPARNLLGRLRNLLSARG